MGEWPGTSIRLHATAGCLIDRSGEVASEMPNPPTSNEEDDGLHSHVVSQEDGCQEEHAMDCQEPLQPALLL